MCIYISYIYMYICIYIYREREREREIFAALAFRLRRALPEDGHIQSPYQDSDPQF